MLFGESLPEKLAMQSPCHVQVRALEARIQKFHPGLLIERCPLARTKTRPQAGRGTRAKGGQRKTTNHGKVTPHTNVDPILTDPCLSN